MPAASFPTHGPLADRVVANALLIAVRQSADVICDRWSICVILAAFLGARRFNDFFQATGITGSLLTSRLRRLETDGVLMKVPYSRRPARYDYRLTNMGEEFFPVLVEMVRWDQRWRPDATNPVLQWITSTAPGRLEAPLVCGACGQPISARDVDVRVSGSRLRKVPQKATTYRRSTIDPQNDSTRTPLLGLSLDLLGDKWSIEIINCAFLPLRRFSDFRTTTGVAANILTDRLSRLVAAGFLKRVDRETDQAVARGYRLTEKGVSFYPVLLRMQAWADAWISDRVKSPINLIHRSCGHLLTWTSEPPKEA